MLMKGSFMLNPRHFRMYRGSDASEQETVEFIIIVA